MTSRLGVQVAANLITALVVVIVGRQMNNLTLSAGKYVLVLPVSVLGGAVFLTIGQALVGLVKSADTVNAGGRMLLIVLILLGLFGQSGTLGGVWESVSQWSPAPACSSWRPGTAVIGCRWWPAPATWRGIRGRRYPLFKWDTR